MASAEAAKCLFHPVLQAVASPGCIESAFLFDLDNNVMNLTASAKQSCISKEYLNVQSY